MQAEEREVEDTIVDKESDCRQALGGRELAHHLRSVAQRQRVAESENIFDLVRPVVGPFVHEDECEAKQVRHEGDPAEGVPEQKSKDAQDEVDPCDEEADLADRHEFRRAD